MKSFGRTLLGLAFKFLLLLLPVLAAASLVFGTATYIKQTLAKNKVYEAAVNSLIAEVEKSAQTGQSGSFPISDPAIQQVIKSSFSAERMQTAGEGVLNGVYDWLSGDTETLQFAVDLTDAKQQLAQGISAVAAARLLALPVCTYAQLQALSSVAIDPFTTVCRPVNLDVATEQQKLSADIASNSEFLEKTVITANELPKNNQGQTIAQQLQVAPTAFQIAKTTPIIIAVLLLVTAASWILLFDDRWRGIRVAAYNLMSAGIMLFISFGFLSFIYGRAAKGEGWFATMNSNEFSRAMSHVATDILSRTNHIVFWFAGSYIFVGGVVWLLLKFVFKKPTTQIPTQK